MEGSHKIDKRERNAESYFCSYFCGKFGRNARCFEGSAKSMDELVDDLKVSIALWTSASPHFHEYYIDHIILNWGEIALL